MSTNFAYFLSAFFVVIMFGLLSGCAAEPHYVQQQSINQPQQHQVQQPRKGNLMSLYPAAIDEQQAIEMHKRRMESAAWRRCTDHSRDC